VALEDTVDVEDNIFINIVKNKSDLLDKILYKNHLTYPAGLALR